VGLAARVGLALRPLAILDGLTLPDDAYLSLTIARNVGRGLGPLYGDAFTNGFQPLYVFLMAPVYALFPENVEGNVHVALVLLAVCDALMATALCALARRITGREVAPLVVAAAWCLNAYVVRITLGGLETSLAALFAVLALLALHRARSGPGLGPVFATGLLAGIAIVARIDNAFLAAAAAASVAFPAGAGVRARALAGARRVALLSAGVAIPVLPWLAYSFAYTGDFYPISGRAIRLTATAVSPLSRDVVQWHLLMLDIAGRTLRDNFGALLAIVAFFAVAATRFAADRGGRAGFLELARALSGAAPAWLYAVPLVLAYPLHVYAVWFFARYFFPAVIPLLLSLGLLVDFLVREVPSERTRTVAALGFAAALLVFTGTRRELRTLATTRDTKAQGYMNLGLWAARTLPRGTAIGSAQTGALSYFAPSLRVVNLDGVVNRACFEALLKKKNLDYVLETGIEYVVGWTVNMRFMKVCSDRPLEPVLEPLGVIEGFRSWGSDWHLYRVRRDLAGTPPPQKEMGGLKPPK
jgi:hypothetical protein